MSIESTSAPAIELSDVSLAFGTVRVFSGASLKISRGETAALTGPSGAGKTSLLALIAGLMRPTSGAVHTLGNDLSAMDEGALAALRRDSIGVVFQHFHLLETMTAQENAALPLELAGKSSAEAAAEAAKFLDAVGLSERRTHFPSQLSGGERQRAAIARAFVARPALLLADEPTGNLDYDTGKAVLDMLLSMARTAGSTMLFVTHNREILQRFDSVHVLREGGLRRDG